MRILSIFTVYLAWASAYQVGNNPFAREEPLGPGFLLRWAVDWDLKRVTFNATVETKGWIGFGLSNNGTVEAGADMVIGGVGPNGKAYFSDRHLDPGSNVPILDRRQDWTLHDAWERGSRTLLSFSRAFDTCDPEDYQITPNKVTLIWKIGREDDEEGLSRTQNEGLYHTHLLDPDYAPEIVRRGSDGDPTLITKNRNENIPSDTKVWTIRRTWTMERNETSYICSIHKIPRLRRKHHMIGFAVHFRDEVSRRHTHHLVFSKCNPPRDVPARQFFEPSVSNPGEPCYLYRGYRGPEHLRFPIQYCSTWTHLWATGGTNFFLPDHLGNPLGIQEDEY